MSLPKNGAAVHFILSDSILSIELSELGHASGMDSFACCRTDAIHRQWQPRVCLHSQEIGVLRPRPIPVAGSYGTEDAGCGF
jgi:hypothetical protein